MGVNSYNVPAWSWPTLNIPNFGKACLSAGTRAGGLIGGLIIATSIGCDPVVECPDSE